MENKFLKIGNKVLFKPNMEGFEYSLEASNVYTISVDPYTDDISFDIAPSFNLPSKIYTTPEDNSFLDRIVKHYNKTECGVTGVMLSGIKGTGKTVTVKRLSILSNLPIILVDKGFRPRLFQKLFKQLSGIEFCMVFDEIDKIGEGYDDSYLLTILDGVNTTGKSLVLFTCNDESKINRNLIDRCSRIRYWRKFKETSRETVRQVLEDRVNDKNEIESLLDFIMNNFKCISYDNICSFVDEVNENPTTTFEILFNDMNLSNK